MRLRNNRHRLILVWTARTGFVLLAILIWTMVMRRGSDATVLPGVHVDGVTSVLARSVDPKGVPLRFEDVTAVSGIRFRHFPVQRGSMLPEDMGSGIACGDFNNDGLPDVFLANFAGSVLDPLPTESEAARCRLFQNVGGMKFEDVTDATGLGLIAHAMAAAWGDYDNDGDLDLYVTAFGANHLFQSQGDGTFRDVTTASGCGDDRFSAGCTWSDFDRDGDLDLYVTNYVHFVFREADRGVSTRQYGSEQPYTLNPSAYPPEPNSLFRNNGDGTFTDVAESAGVADRTGRSLSAVWADFNNDTWPDLYVANDVSNNGVFLNRGDGTFEDVGPSSLAADYRGAMGIAVGDFDHDLDLDLFITHWIAQENALFRNMFVDPMFEASTAKRLWFLDSADALGLGQISLDAVGWATGFADLDNDGQTDLWVVNGSTLEHAGDHSRLVPQRAYIFHGRGKDGFMEVTATAAPALVDKPLVGRGGVQADFDLDGLLDLMILVHGDEPVMLRNVTASAGHYLRVQLGQNGANRFAVGGRVYVKAGATSWMAEAGAAGSYLSQNEQTLHFGIGSHETIDLLRIIWPDGAEETHRSLPSDRRMSFTHTPAYPAS